MSIAIGYYCDDCGTLDWSCKEWCNTCGEKTRRMIYEQTKAYRTIRGDTEEYYYWKLVKNINYDDKGPPHAIQFERHPKNTKPKYHLPEHLFEVDI